MSSSPSAPHLLYLSPSISSDYATLHSNACLRSVSAYSCGTAKEYGNVSSPLFSTCAHIACSISQKKSNGVIWYILGVNTVLVTLPLDIAVVSVLMYVSSLLFRRLILLTPSLQLVVGRHRRINFWTPLWLTNTPPSSPASYFRSSSSTAQEPCRVHCCCDYGRRRCSRILVACGANETDEGREWVELDVGGGRRQFNK